MELSTWLRRWTVKITPAKNRFMITYTGRKIYPLDPDPDAICIEDIAHHLSNICRFTGAVKTHYNVAQHSIIVANFSGFPLHGLMHDAAEAYLADITSTIKSMFPDFIKAEKLLMEAIYAAFDFPDMSEDVKEAIWMADKAVLRVEWDALMNDSNGYGLGIDMSTVPYLHFELGGCWMPVEAERVFLKRFKELYS